MARRSCPLEGFEQCDTVPDELKKLNRSFLALFRILGDPIKLDLFSKSRFTKHCKWAPDDSVETQFRRLARFLDRRRSSRDRLQLNQGFQRGRAEDLARYSQPSLEGFDQLQDFRLRFAVRPVVQKVGLCS
jgi:hypothetical protein